MNIKSTPDRARKNSLTMDILSTPDIELFDTGKFEAALSTSAYSENPLPLFRDTLKSGGQTLKKRFENNIPADKLVGGRAYLVDQLLQHAWRLFFKNQSQDLSQNRNDNDIALIAVGGYGRGELHPHSDIDLMILLAIDNREQYQEQIERFLTFLWDIGLEVGHSVRTLSDCVNEGKQDITVTTNLMEARLLTGHETLFEKMRTVTSPEYIWPSDRFFGAKWEEQKRRHRKFGDTAYKLEPNIKEGPGCLRDIQVIGWVAKRHFGAHTLHDLVKHNFLTEKEYSTLIEGQNFLWRIRFALHILTNRREDRLLFDYQRTLAKQFGYKDANNNLAVEQFMQSYYRTIMELDRLNEMLLQLFQEAIIYANFPINERFRSRMGFIAVTHDKVFTEDPLALLEIFLLLEQHQELNGVRANTIRLIRDNCHLINDEFRQDPRAIDLFMQIIRQPQGLTHELRRMNRYGVLAAYLPAFSRIVGRMQYDLFHTLTVDEHSLFVVRNLRRFTVPEFYDEFPLCSELIQTFNKPELLYIAGLFHDIAKGRGGDHSELGAEEARSFCLQHKINQEDAEFVAWLIQNHLLMSLTAQKKDISDPEVINEFASKIIDKTHLDYLYLLTVADIRATNPNMWNSWKDALFKELYHATNKALVRNLALPDNKILIDEIREKVQPALEKIGISGEQIDHQWKDFSDEYFLYYSPDEMIWHMSSIAQSNEDELPLIEVRPIKERGSTAIFIYGPCQNGQFAIITSTLDQLGLNIVDARIMTSKQDFTLDTYLVLEENGEAIEDEYRLHEIQNTLIQNLEKNKDPAFFASRFVSRRQARQVKHFEIPTRISFEKDSNNRRTIMKVVTADRPGLLSLVAQAFVKCNIKLQIARISTIGAQAEDVFYISDQDNNPLEDEAQRRTLMETTINILDE